ncbi:gephyrin-like molybdotransferase Glp, partial [candidate division KSB1 bacterium]
MIHVKEAYEIIDSVIRRNPETTAGLKDCPGYVLSSDICAEDNIPLCDNSAMDGFAVKFTDLKNASTENPVVLDVIDEIPAGRVSEKTLENGQAVRIMTGGVVPEGAGAVIKKEDTDDNGDIVRIFASSFEGENIRRAGEDIRKGEKVLSAGEMIKPADAGILASLGVVNVPVYEKPVAALLVTGDEIIPPEEELVPGKVRNSNLYTLTALLKKSGITVQELPQGRDSLERLKKILESALDAGILITSGAVSVGKYDFLKTALLELGMTEHFWRVKQKPGKPLLFGSLGDTPVFGLPGNPVSVMVSFLMYVEPAIRKMMGFRNYMPAKISASLDSAYEKPAGLTHFIRGSYRFSAGKVTARPFDRQGSGILRSMSV